MDSSFGVPIICLEDKQNIFEYATRYLGHRASATLIRCPATLRDIVNLADHIGSAVCLSSANFLGELPPASRHKLCAGKLQVLVVLEAKKDDELAIPYLWEGCSGLLHLDDSPEIWERAMAAVAAGELWVPRRMMSRLLQEMVRLGGHPEHKITRRESEILELIGVGHDNKQIANDLFISKETVRWHVRSLYSKIGVSDREGAIRFWRLSRKDRSG
jgi:DNA-binding NarL/FixJ family response regulator